MEIVSQKLVLEFEGLGITNKKFKNLFVCVRHLLQSFPLRLKESKCILSPCHLNVPNKDISITLNIVKIYAPSYYKESKTSVDRKFPDPARFHIRLKVATYYYPWVYFYLDLHSRKTIKLYKCLATVPVFSFQRNPLAAIHFKPSKKNSHCSDKLGSLSNELYKCIIESGTVRNNAAPLVNSTLHSFEKDQNNKSKHSRSTTKGFVLFYLLYVAQVISTVICEKNQRKLRRTNRTCYNSKKVQKYSHYRTSSSNFFFLRDIKSLFLTYVIFSKAIVWTNGEIQTLNITTNTSSKSSFVNTFYQIV